MGSVAHVGARVCLFVLSAGCGLYDRTLIEHDDRVASMPESTDEGRARRRAQGYAVDWVEPPPSAAGAGSAGAAASSRGDAGIEQRPMAGHAGAGNASPADQDAGPASEPELTDSAKCMGRLGYVAASGHCYVLLMEEVSWYVARDLCMQRKGHLASITSPQEQAFLKRIPRQGALWIGLSKFGAPSYSWITGEILSFVAWQSGAPSTRSEGGALLDPKTGAWQDAPPSQTHPALCELESS